MPRPGKLSILVSGGVLCALTAASVTAATWPGEIPAAFTSKATTADFAVGGHQAQFGAQSAAPAAAMAPGTGDIRAIKLAAAARSRQIQLAQMRATAARAHQAHQAHLAVLAKRAAQAREAAAARAAAARKAAAQKAAASSPGSSGSSGSSSSAPAPSGSPRQIAQQILAARGVSGQFSCLDSLWARESGWNVYAQNPGSGAYGIPQSLPGSKMASAGPDWQSNAATQIKWGLSYIDSTYGSPCAAWAHSQATGWY
jgi:hypothetical protein